MVLFFFSHAGGSAKSYVSFKRFLPKETTVIPMELSGRFTRMSEPLLDNVADCIADLIEKHSEDIKGEYQKVLNAFLRQGVIPGFRKGKVPLPVIKQKFQQEIADESKQACFRAFYPKALKESGLEDVAVNLQNITDVLFAPETGFSFTAHVEVKPTFDLPKYKKLALKKGDTSVSEEQVTDRVESFRRAFAKFEDAKEGDVIGDGDPTCSDL